MTTKDEIDKQLNLPASGIGASYTKQNEIRSKRLEVISTADDNINVTEPSPPMHSEYPYNKTKQSISGHLEEIDDTPGAERTLRMHKSGTFEEIHPDGTKVTKIFGDDFYLALVDHTLYVGGNLNISVQGNANILTKGNVKQKIGGDYDVTVHGNMTTRVEGTRLDYTKGNADIQTASELKIRSKLSTDMFCGATLDIYALDATTLKSESTMKINSFSNMNLTTSGSFVAKSMGTWHGHSAGNFYLDGSRIDLNLPGPVKTVDSIASNDPLDKDPTGGLNIMDNISEPAAETLMIIRADNTTLGPIINNNATYPKDRTGELLTTTSSTNVNYTMDYDSIWLLGVFNTKFDTLQSQFTTHITDYTNPHQVTAIQVGAPDLQTMTDNAVFRANGTTGQYQNSDVYIDDLGNVGIGVVSPTSALELKAGTATVSPLKFNSGTLMTVPEKGAFEFFDDHLYFSKRAGIRYGTVLANGVKTTTTTVTNTTTETDIFTQTWPANTFHADEVIEIVLSGTFTNASASDDFTVRVDVGGIVHTFARAGGNETDAGWEIVARFIIRTIGATGTYVDFIKYTENGNTVYASAHQEHTFNSTISNDFSVSVQWVNAKAGNTFSCTQGFVRYNH